MIAQLLEEFMVELLEIAKLADTRSGAEKRECVLNIAMLMDTFKLNQLAPIYRENFIEVNTGGTAPQVQDESFELPPV